MSHFEVRFHLSPGINHRKWQIKNYHDGKKTVVYFDPAQIQLELTNCLLVNKINKARKVHREGVKDVSGWIRCDVVAIISEPYPVFHLERLFYNPIVDPQWKREGDDGSFAWDGFRFQTLLTNGRSVCILEERN